MNQHYHEPTTSCLQSHFMTTTPTTYSCLPSSSIQPAFPYLPSESKPKRGMSPTIDEVGLVTQRSQYPQFLFHQRSIKPSIQSHVAPSISVAPSINISSISFSAWHLTSTKLSSVKQQLSLSLDRVWKTERSHKNRNSHAHNG